MDVIQMISLPVSFLSLAWAFKTADEMIHKGEGAVDALRVIHQIALFITNCFVYLQFLPSRSATSGGLSSCCFIRS